MFRMGKFVSFYKNCSKHLIDAKTKIIKESKDGPRYIKISRTKITENWARIAAGIKRSPRTKNNNNEMLQKLNEFKSDVNFKPKMDVSSMRQDFGDKIKNLNKRILDEKLNKFKSNVNFKPKLDVWSMRKDFGDKIKNVNKGILDNKYMPLLRFGFTKMPIVRNYLKIGALFKRNRLKQNKYNVIARMKESWGNRRMAKEIEERKRLDKLQFQKAGEGPVVKTYKSDPRREQRFMRNKQIK